MIITRISNNFDDMDTAYSDLYEKHTKFEAKLTNQNKERLLESIKVFKQKMKNYENAVKSIYISDKGSAFVRKEKK